MKTELTTAVLIRNLRRDVEIAKDRVKAAIAVRHALDFDLRLAKRIAGKQAENLTAYVSSYGINTRLYATLRLQVESLKTDPVLLRVLGRALDHATPKETSDYATSYSAERSYAFTLPSGGNLTIEASLKTDSPTCFKRVSGTTLREDVTYEIVCK